MHKAVYWALYQVCFQNRSELCSCAIQPVSAKKNKQKNKNKQKPPNLRTPSSGIDPLQMMSFLLATLAAAMTGDQQPLEQYVLLRN